MAWYANEVSSALWHLYSIGLDKVGGQYSGSSVKVGIFDDGVQTDHPALLGNYSYALEPTLSGQTLNDEPGLHGTAVAGLIAAREIGTGPVGVAAGAQIAGVDIFSGPGASSLGQTIRLMKKFDVVNNSWGSGGCYSDGPQTSYGIGGDYGSALAHVAEYGRRGLGTVVVNAAGNDWTFDRRDANTSAFNQDRHTITVGAVSDIDQVSSYSTRGASVLVCAPSSGGTKGITTTDLTGTDGYEGGAETSTFGGTSAATPIVSGVVALMLEANRRLGWRDVQDILAYSADGVGSTAPTSHAFASTVNGAKNFNGGGLHFSNDVGFGKVDAYSAVRMAEAWSLFGRAETSDNEAVASAEGAVSRPLRDNRTASFGFTVRGAVDLEHVDLTLKLNHRDVSQLQVELISPRGTKSTLLSPGGDSLSVRNWTWTFGSEEFRGEAAQGVWTVRVKDTGYGAGGTITGFAFDGFGDRASRDDVYHFTDEFAALRHADRSRAAVSDRDGGVDWLNLAAIAEDVRIDLRSGARSFTGGETSLLIARGTLIENGVTGDGNDVLRGNALKNRLVGMRGDDRLDGGGGGDVLEGGSGADTAAYAHSNARVDVNLRSGRGSGGDAQGDLLRGIENLVGSRFGDKLIGNGGSNRLDGGRGNDVLIGGSGADTFVFAGRSFGRDAILDFEDGIDRIDLSALSLTPAALVVAPYAGGAVVSTGSGSILLKGENAAWITADDFIL
jgi:subtilisin-like proprotein convertase family protein